ncbi:hypothetical protein Tco_1096672 [Tanacetum coccineum]
MWERFSLCFDQSSQYSIDHQLQGIQEDLNQQRMNDECIKSHNDMIESRNELFKTMQSLGEMLRQREQTTNLSTHTPKPSRRFNSICYDNDDDEDSTIPLNEIISQIPPSIAITPVLPTMEPEDSLIIGDENLSTIPEKESDEVIKSNVEDLVPIPSESRDTSDNDSECDWPFCDNSSPLDILGVNSMTFFNPLFDSNDDFISTDDESLPEEDDIGNKDSYVSNLDELALLVTPLFDANKDECFDPGGDIDEIDAFLDIDVSTDIEDGYHDSEGEIIYLESLFINDIIPNLPPEVFLDHDLKSLDEPNIDDLKIKENVRITFADHHYLSHTFVIKIFLPFLTYPVNSLLLLSSGSEDTIFDPGISAYSFCSLEPVAYESPMMIFPFFCFYPKDKGIRDIPSGEIKKQVTKSKSILFSRTLSSRRSTWHASNITSGHAGDPEVSYWLKGRGANLRDKKDGLELVINQGWRLKLKDVPLLLDPSIICYK